MRARIATAASLMVLSVGLPVALGACGGGDDTEAQAATEKDFDHGNFSNPTEIDNKHRPEAQTVTGKQKIELDQAAIYAKRNTRTIFGK